MNDARRTCLAALTLFVATFAPAAVAEEPPAPEGNPKAEQPKKVPLEDLEPFARLERATRNISAQVQNAYVSLRESPQVDKGGLRKSHERVIRNAAMSCCANNVEIITDRLEHSTNAIKELYAMHQEDGNEAGQQLVLHMYEHIKDEYRGFKDFRTASAEPPAKRGLDIMKNALLHLRRDFEEYHDCCVSD